MSTVRGPVAQSLSEERVHVFDYVDDLLESVTVVSATGTLLAPDGTASATATPTVSSPYVYITVGPLTETGQYVLDCDATCSDGEVLNVRLLINVGY
jgi:hypothetical protein